MTVVPGLASDGMVAPFVVNGLANHTAFDTYIERVLIPEMRPRDVVVMDTLSSHKGDCTRALIELLGAKLHFMPPYSPDFNPIENAFSRRRAATRTVSTFSTTFSPA